LILILGVNTYRDTDYDNDRRNDAYRYQSELPLYDEGDDECRDEGRYTLDDQCKLLGYTVVNIISVRRSLRRN
jgi:hypothetical protein